MYKIGERVIHRNYGIGTIIGVEEKKLGKKANEYYVVETSEVTLWIPIDATEARIRYPMETTAFQDLLTHLDGAGEQLPDHHIARGQLLIERMKTRSMTDLCNIIHDLTSRSRTQLLTKNDNEFLNRAKELLLNEWEAVLGIPRELARKELTELLEGISEVVESPLET